MYAAALKKRVMNGSVVPMLEKPRHDAINAKLATLFTTFYQGDALTNLEKDIERQYINQKCQKMQAYTTKKSKSNKTHWTISDLNRYQDQKNYRMNDMEYFGHTKPEFEPYDLDKALELVSVFQDIDQASRFRRAMTWLKELSYLERGSKRS